MSFRAQLTGFGYGGSMTGEGWPEYVMLDNGGILSVEYETLAYYPVDRDALLALADEIDEYADGGGARFGRVVDRARAEGYARRIREALGVRDG